jgi:CDP-glycerol glycerophosphotransferase
MMTQFLIKLSRRYAIFYYLKRGYQFVRDHYQPYYYAHQSVRPKSVIFESFRSTGYVDSPKAIYEYMLNSSEYKDYTFIWSFREPHKYKHLKSKRTKLVRHESHAYYTAFARAQYWVVNGWIPLKIKKYSGQTALQCWHGTPLKRLRYDIVGTADTNHRRAGIAKNDEDVKRFDYFISPSKFASKAFTTSFNLKNLGMEDILIETGYPRNDFLATLKKSQIKSLKAKLMLPSDKKILLYAPTWRDDQKQEGKGFIYQPPINFEYLKQRLENEYIILFRAHNLISNSFDFDRLGGFVRDVSKVDDINELYAVSDVLMTDYSSVFFDYGNLQRPMIFYMYDIEHYTQGLRGFYLDLRDLPGDVVKTKEEVADILSRLPAYAKKYNIKLRKFHDTFNPLDDGSATARVVTEVFGDG